MKIANDDLVEDDSQGVDVALDGGLAADEVFGCRVEPCAAIRTAGRANEERFGETAVRDSQFVEFLGLFAIFGQFLGAFKSGLRYL